MDDPTKPRAWRARPRIGNRHRNGTSHIETRLNGALLGHRGQARNAPWVPVPRALEANRKSRRWVGAIAAALASLPPLVLFSACGSAHDPVTIYRGSVVEQPSIEVLPTDPQPWDERSSEFKLGWTLAEVSFTMEAPSKPAITGSTLEQWAKTAFKDWFQAKVDVVEKAREELTEAASDDRQERIMAAAIVALMYEDMAQGLASLSDTRLPTDMQHSATGPDLSEHDTYQESYVAHAREAYKACAKNAQKNNRLGHWSGFCRERGGRLQ